jgi:hypothetical protein
MSLRTVNRHVWTVALLASLLLTLALMPPRPVHSQAGTAALAACARMAFSTEEDFLTQGPTPADGNPIISDGDLLSPDGSVCARNADLLRPFDVSRDLGLDAVDIVSVDNYLLVFSTELDDPVGRFTAGDLLATNGAMIPNVALTYRFTLGYDIGLDALQLIGDLESISAFLAEAKTRGRRYFLDNPRVLFEMLNQYNVDIWFSTEGTAPAPGQPKLLDGDLLSARNGVIIASNSDLLPPEVPAGLPNRGVDFGLDAFATRSRDPKLARELGFFSTEILYQALKDMTGFTDGDVLRVGDDVAFKNMDLIGAFEPKVTELGLDALYLMPYGPPPQCYASLTALGGTQAPVANLHPTTGLVSLGLPTRHPFGYDVPFWGHIASCVTKFRVVYRPAGDAGEGTPILPGTWSVGDPSTWSGITFQCEGTMPRPPADAQGYYGGPEYLNLLQCDQLPLTNWHSPSAPDPDGLYEVRLDYVVGANTLHTPWYRVQLDNTLPKIDNMKLIVKSGSSGGSPTCPVYSAANMPLTLQGQFSDDYFWRYQAWIDGDLYPAHTYTLTNYYDGTPPAANLDDTGTTPDGTLVNLHPVSVYDIVAAPADCCYSVELIVWDRVIWGSFWGSRALVSGQVGRWVTDDIYFAFKP